MRHPDTAICPTRGCGAQPDFLQDPGAGWYAICLDCYDGEGFEASGATIGECADAWNEYVHEQG